MGPVLPEVLQRGLVERTSSVFRRNVVGDRVELGDGVKEAIGRVGHADLLVPGVPGWGLILNGALRRAKGQYPSIQRGPAISSRKEDAISDNGRTPVEDAALSPLRERLWFIFVMMCVLPPYGLVLFWRLEDFPPEAKWLVTLVIVGAIISAVLLAGKR
jgi:hypothetical protein